jgi:hypothetical protein
MHIFCGRDAFLDADSACDGIQNSISSAFQFPEVSQLRQPLKTTKNHQKFKNSSIWELMSVFPETSVTALVQKPRKSPKLIYIYSIMHHKCTENG